MSHLKKLLLSFATTIRRLRFRVSLKFFLIVVATLGAVSGIGAYYFRYAVQRDHALRALLRDGRNRIEWGEDHGPRLVRRLLLVVFGRANHYVYAFFGNAERFEGDGSHFRDDDAKWLESLPELQDVFLDSIHITDQTLFHLRKLHALKRLILGNAFDERPRQITDAGLAYLNQMRDLRWLELGGTQITDAGIEHFAPLGSLKYVGLAHTRITDEGIRRLSLLAPGLEGLNLFDTKVTAKSAEFLIAMPNLKIVLVRVESYSDAAPWRAFKALRPDLKIAFDGTELHAWAMTHRSP